MQKNKPASLFAADSSVIFAILADHEGGDLIHEIIAVVGVNLQGDGLGKVQAEDAQDGLAVDDVTADAQVDVIRMTVYDIDKGLDVLCKAQLDIHCFHVVVPLITYSIFVTGVLLIKILYSTNINYASEFLVRRKMALDIFIKKVQKVEKILLTNDWRGDIITPVS